MSEFDKVANDILKGLNENFINSAADAIQHTWAKTIAHPGLGEEDEEFAVVDHSLTSDGVIEEYYVEYKGQLVSVPADEARVVVYTSILNNFIYSPIPSCGTWSAAIQIVLFAL